MEWGEAIRQVQILRSDPGTMTAAAIEGWDYPFPRELAATADLFDLEYAKTGSKNRKPYQRPFKVGGGEVQKFGNTGGRTQAEVHAILRSLGHRLPVSA
ncbi:MAG: hypothetical protein ACRED4_03235 [Brevundimonas sp.]